MYVCRARQYTEKYDLEDRYETSIRRTAASMHQHGLDAAFSAKQAAEAAPHSYAILTGLRTFLHASRDILWILIYPHTLPEWPLGEFLELTRSKLWGKDELRGEKAQSLRSPITNVEDKQRHRSRQNGGGGLYASRQDLLMKYLESNVSQVWAAGTRAAMEVWLGWLAAVLNLDRNFVVPCSLPEIGGRLLLMLCGTEVQTAYDDFVFRIRESPGYFSTVIGERGAQPYVTLKLHVYVHHSGARETPLRETLW